MKARCLDGSCGLHGWALGYLSGLVFHSGTFHCSHTLNSSLITFIMGPSLSQSLTLLALLPGRTLSPSSLANTYTSFKTSSNSNPCPDSLLISICCRSTTTYRDYGTSHPLPASSLKPYPATLPPTPTLSAIGGRGSILFIFKTLATNTIPGTYWALSKY